MDTDILSEAQLEPLGRRFIPSGTLEKLLQARGIRYLLIGAHALGELTREPRATQDVDLIVQDKDVDRTIALLTQTFSLQAHGTRLKDDQGNTLIDILSDRHPIYRMAMRSGERIPSREGLAVMKFLSSISPLRRKDKKIQDKADFYNLARTQRLDRTQVLHLLYMADNPLEYETHRDQILQWIQDSEIPDESGEIS